MFLIAMMELNSRFYKPTRFVTVMCLLAILATPSVSAVEPVGDIFISEMCVDHKGEKVEPGERYFPMGTDRCTECTCINGKSEMCISVFCSPPENCRQPHELNDKCCEFVCLDGDLDRPISNHNNTVLRTNDSEAINATNLGLRLVASTVTSFLILALLLFMIHRLRQRRLLLMIRRIQSRRMQAAGNHLSRRLSLEDDGSVGYFVGHDQIDFAHYSDPPPPYMFWKPPEAYMPPGEAPPPYEASIGAPYNTFYALLNGTLVDVTRNDGTLNSTYANMGTVLNSQGQIPSNDHCALPPTPPKRVEDRGTQAPPPPTSQPQVSDQSVQAYQLSHSESTSTVSMRSDNDTTNNGGTEPAAIASDAQYEDIQSYVPNNVTVLHIGESVTPVINLRDEDLVNGNVYPGTTVKELYTSIAQTHRAAPCPCGNARNADHRTSNGNCRHKCHSYGDFVNYWQNHMANRRHGERRRHSLQPPGNGQNNNFYPDPTCWAGEGSESSSSSSPTYEQPTLSPSSSDSSSMDVDFEPESFHASNKDGASTTTQNPNRSEIKSSRKSSSLDKRLLQLKKFSIPHSKKKADKVTQVEENQIQTSSSTNTSTLRHSQTGVRNQCSAFCNELKGARASLKPVFTVEAVNKVFSERQIPKQTGMSSSEQSKANKPRNDSSWITQVPHVTLRPTSLPLPPENDKSSKVHSECSSAASNNTCSCGPSCSCSSTTCVPVSPPMIGIHSSATATISHLNRGPPVSPPSSSDLSTDGVEAYITQQQAIHLPVVQSKSHPGSSVKPKVSISCMSCHSSGTDQCSHVTQSGVTLHSRRTKSDVSVIKEILKEKCRDNGHDSSSCANNESSSSYSDTECREPPEGGRCSRLDHGNSAGYHKSSKKGGKMKTANKLMSGALSKTDSQLASQDVCQHRDTEGRAESKSVSSGNGPNHRTEESVSSTIQKFEVRSGKEQKSRKGT